MDVFICFLAIAGNCLFVAQKLANQLETGNYRHMLPNLRSVYVCFGNIDVVCRLNFKADAENNSTPLARAFRA